MQVLTYTKNYGALLTDIQLNKEYSFGDENIKFSTNLHNINNEYIPTTFQYSNLHDYFPKIKFVWNPKEGENYFDINKNFYIIDYIYVCINNYYELRIIDNYGNIHVSGMRNVDSPKIICFDSNILTNKENEEILSDQVIDHIKNNNLIINWSNTSVNITNKINEIKNIQKIAGMGKQKTIKYVLDQPQEILELEYESNEIIQDLIISFPDCDPWEKADELFTKYKDRLVELSKIQANENEIMSEIIHKKNNIEKLIAINNDIDDDEILALIEKKKEKLQSFELQINELFERNNNRRCEMNKLKILLTKLNNVPEKKLSTEFV